MTLLGWDGGLDAHLAVQQRQVRARLRGTVERLPEQPYELVVVRETDRPVQRVRAVHRRDRALGVGVVDEAVHHGPVSPAPAIREPQVTDERRRRVGVPARVRAVDPARRGRAAPDPHILARGFDRVVGLGEEGEVRGCGDVSPPGPNWGSQKRLRFGSLPTITSRNEGSVAVSAAVYEANCARAVGESGVADDPRG